MLSLGLRPSSRAILRPFPMISNLEALSAISGFAGAYSGLSGNTPLEPAFVSYFGRAGDLEQVPFNQTSWSAFDSSIPYLVGLYPNRRCLWSIVCPVRGDHAAIAAGTGIAYGSRTYDAIHTDAANAILNQPYNQNNPTKLIFIRIDHEFNLAYQPMAATNAAGNATDYANFIAAWQRRVNLFRAVSTRFVFVFCHNLGSSTDLVDPAQCWPGDAYVDVIAPDTYFNDTYSSNSLSDGSAGGSAWDYINTGIDRGFDWTKTFAAAHGKRVGLSEWGANNNGATGWVQKTINWLSANNAVFNLYWNSTADINCMLSDNHLPALSLLYKTTYGYTPPVIAPTNTAAPTISGTPQVGQTLTASTGTWSNTPTSYTYVWKAGTTTVQSGSSNTYTPQSGDVGQTITVTVTATNSAGSATSVSAATAAVVAASTSNNLTLRDGTPLTLRDATPLTLRAA